MAAVSWKAVDVRSTKHPLPGSYRRSCRRPAVEVEKVWETGVAGAVRQARLCRWRRGAWRARRPGKPQPCLAGCGAWCGLWDGGISHERRLRGRVLCMLLSAESVRNCGAGAEGRPTKSPVTEGWRPQLATA